jgi:hypothetical protein
VQVSRDGAAVVLAVGTGLLGLLVPAASPRTPKAGFCSAWRHPLSRWSTAACTRCWTTGCITVGYRCGEAAVFIRGGIGPPLLFVFALVILLFPDGSLPRRWTWVLWLYLAVAVVATVGIAAGEAGSIAGQHIEVDVNGDYSGPGSPSGVLGVLATITTPVLVVVPLFWPAFVARQVFSWRRSAGDRRQQLKWLMAGAVIGLVGVMLIVVGPPNDQLSGRVARDLAFVALGALPVSIGVGIQPPVSEYAATAH